MEKDEEGKKGEENTMKYHPSAVVDKLIITMSPN